MAQGRGAQGNGACAGASAVMSRKLLASNIEQ